MKTTMVFRGMIMPSIKKKPGRWDSVASKDRQLLVECDLAVDTKLQRTGRTGVTKNDWGYTPYINYGYHVYIYIYNIYIYIYNI